jgi:hypothetical protein
MTVDRTQPHRRFALAALLACATAAALAPAAHAAGSLGIAKWEAGTCNGSETEVKECTYSSPHSAFYTQAAGHPPWGLTGFELASSGGAPTGSALKRIRVDVPPGLAADPQALGVCSRAQFESKSCPADSQAGFVELKAYVETTLPITTTLKGKVFNLPQEAGLPLQFGIDVEGEPLAEDVHLIMRGHVSYAHEAALEARGVPSGDYHEWFEIDNIPTEATVLGLAKAKLKTLESKLFFDGHAGKEGKSNFLTMPSNCAEPVTSYLELEAYNGEKAQKATTPPVGVEGCDKVPFAPTATLVPETSQYDAPDGATAVVRVPQHERSDEINTADINDAHVTLPEGVTLNPAAASVLETCSPAQIAIGGSSPVTCPAGSKIGTVSIETDLPPGSLGGNVYLGAPEGTPITEPPYTIYIDAESVYGVSVRLQGSVDPNPATGRLEVSFLGNPQLPFSSLSLTSNGGPHAPLANPLACGSAETGFLFTPWTGAGAAEGSTPFTTDGNGSGGACPSPIPFALAQSTQTSTTAAGAFTSFAFNLARPEGEQYVRRVFTVLPPGLVGLIPSVSLCQEPQAAAGTCSAASQIGTAVASAGSGSEPTSFGGPVFLTGPTNGSPYGLSIPIEARSGPFDLGAIVTRAAINVDPHSARVIADATIASITPRGGVPLRLRTISVAVNRPNFLFNPSSCNTLATESAITSTFGATRGLSSPFAPSACGALAFKPTFTAATSAKTSRAKGASLQVTITQAPHQANMRSIVASLPSQLPSRLTTLQKACPEATYAANPRSCPEASMVGTATVRTPVLPNPLSGPAYLVSHGGAAFPDLDLLLEGDGVHVILEGNTNIKGGITTSTFASIPDVPVSSVSLTLPTGPHSALAAFGSFCGKKLIMPTTITAQNGAQIKQSTRIVVTGCGVRIVRHRVKGRRLLLIVQTYSAGRVAVKGRGLRTRYRRVRGATTITMSVPLSRGGARNLAGRRRLKIRVRVSFVPKVRAEGSSTAFATVTFKKKR